MCTFWSALPLFRLVLVGIVMAAVALAAFTYALNEQEEAPLEKSTQASTPATQTIAASCWAGHLPLGAALLQERGSTCASSSLTLRVVTASATTTCTSKALPLRYSFNYYASEKDHSYYLYRGHLLPSPLVQRRALHVHAQTRPARASVALSLEFPSRSCISSTTPCYYYYY